MMWHSKKNYLLRLSHFLFGLTLSIGYCAPSFGDVKPDTPDGEADENTEKVSVLPLEDLRTFTQTYETIRRAYIDEIDDKTLLEYAIRGMLQQLDPHSAYLDEESSKELHISTSGEFGGLGIEVGMEDGFVKVISPIDDTPAAKAGVEAGDLIIKLDDTSVKGMTLNDAVKLMRGPKGAAIVLTIVRQGEDKPIDITIVRDTIKVRSVSTKIVEEDYAYIRIAQFQMHTGDDVKKGLKKLLKKNPGIKGVVLDLRNNPGGLLQAAIEISDHFLRSGKIVYTEGRLDNASSEAIATPGDIAEGLPMVVLINGGSASASEIVAGALQDHRRALVIGTQSFGKGSVQRIFPITETKNIKITTSLYFTPSGRSIQAKGIEPDITVERVKVTAVGGRSRVSEADLSGHLKNANGEKDVKSKDKKPDRESGDLHNDDSQLYEALNLLKGLYLFQQQSLFAPEQGEKNADTSELDNEEGEPAS